MNEQERYGSIGRESGVVLPFVPKGNRELTFEQHIYWQEQLEIAERKVEYAKRMLGRIGIEKGLEG